MNVVTMSQFLSFFLTINVCLLTCQCFMFSKSKENLPDTKVINGQFASIRDFPYMVSLQHNGTFYGHDYEHFCCGSILNEKWIITSAQCGQAQNSFKFHVRVGSDKYYENGVIHFIDKVVIHPNFNEISRDYDVALLKLSKSIVFNHNAKPIKLPKGNDVIQDTKVLSIAGWGATKILGKVSDQLLTGQIPKINDKTCQSMYGSDGITSRMFCLHREGYGACVGDSGSPAVYDNKLIGLASWSGGCAQYPTVYAKLTSVLNWIKDTIKET